MKNKWQIEIRSKELQELIEEEIYDSVKGRVLRGQIGVLEWLLGLRDNVVTGAGDPGYKSKKAINEMIRQVKAEKKKLPEYSESGDPNWVIADVRVEILVWAKEEENARR